jgi:hypothetical protein
VGERHHTIYSRDIESIMVEEAYAAARAVLAAERTASLFAS